MWWRRYRSARSATGCAPAAPVAAARLPGRQQPAPCLSIRAGAVGAAPGTRRQYPAARAAAPGIRACRCRQRRRRCARPCRPGSWRSRRARRGWPASCAGPSASPRRPTPHRPQTRPPWMRVCVRRRRAPTAGSKRLGALRRGVTLRAGAQQTDWACEEAGGRQRHSPPPERKLAGDTEPHRAWAPPRPTAGMSVPMPTAGARRRRPGRSAATVQGPSAPWRRGRPRPGCSALPIRPEGLGAPGRPPAPAQPGASRPEARPPCCGTMSGLRQACGMISSGGQGCRGVHEPAPSCRPAVRRLVPTPNAWVWARFGLQEGCNDRWAAAQRGAGRQLGRGLAALVHPRPARPSVQHKTYELRPRLRCSARPPCASTPSSQVTGAWARQ